MYAFKIYLGRKHLDTVFYNMTDSEDVRRAEAINYPSGFHVIREGKPLGRIQQDMIHCLKKFEFWNKNSGWLWSHPSGTVKILESLVNRGLVTVSGGTYRLKK